MENYYQKSFGLATPADTLIFSSYFETGEAGVTPYFPAASGCGFDVFFDNVSRCLILVTYSSIRAFISATAVIYSSGSSYSSVSISVSI
jgi:hypothetical protein